MTARPTRSGIRDSEGTGGQGTGRQRTSRINPNQPNHKSAAPATVRKAVRGHGLVSQSRGACYGPHGVRSAARLGLGKGRDGLAAWAPRFAGGRRIKLGFAHASLVIGRRRGFAHEPMPPAQPSPHRCVGQRFCGSAGLGLMREVRCLPVPWPPVPSLSRIRCRVGRAVMDV